MTDAVINLPPNLDSGTAGGLQALRNTTGLQGGGNKINCVNYSFTVVGKDVHGFEWNLYAQMDNYANDVPGVRTEHVAFYAKANKHGTATNWAACLEVHDHLGQGACVGAEVDIWTKGPDNGSRIGLDVMMAGSNNVNDPVQDVGATAAIRSSASNPLAYWSFGALFRGIRDAGVQVTSWLAGGVRAFEAKGKWIVGLDLSQATFDADAIRMAPGQKWSFEPTGQRYMTYKAWTPDGKGDRLQYVVNGSPAFEIDGAGNLHLKGKVLPL